MSAPASFNLFSMLTYGDRFKSLLRATNKYIQEGEIMNLENIIEKKNN